MKLRAADLFCGGGGTSTGAHSTGGVDVVFALNHWHRAIETHSANFPRTHHVNSRLEDTHPGECGKIDLLFASPECIHHSRARGGRPTSDQQRSGAWHVLPWIEHHRPSWVVIENVSEFRDWGPIGNHGKPLASKRGAFFDAWIMAIQAAGYKADFQQLNAANFGAATSRNRLFIVARKGNRNPVFPEPTHGKHAGGELPGMSLRPWRAAAEVVDWSIPCPSVFSRPRPLADKTLLRIEAGLRRFVGPFVAQFNEGADRRVHSIDAPLSTVTANGKKFGIAVPYQVVMRNNMASADCQSPIGTITAGGGHHGIAVPFIAQWDHHGGNGDYVRGMTDPLATMTTKANMAVVTPFLADVNHGGAEDRSYSINDSLGTITSKNGKAICVPWIGHYYGTNNQSPVTDPLDTITTKHRHALCVAVCRGPEDWPSPASDAMRLLQSTMRSMGVCDIGFRMLSNPELSLAQGFPANYIYRGSKAEITRMIGNSVSPPVACAITRAILSV